MRNGGGAYSASSPQGLGCRKATRSGSAERIDLLTVARASRRVVNISASISLAEAIGSSVAIPAGPA